MPQALRQPVAENAIHRNGHQPFQRTIGDLLTSMARDDVNCAFVRHELEQLRKEKPHAPTG